MTQATPRRAVLLLVGAVALLALAGPLVKWLVREGGSSGLVAPGALSFCNVLFVGNLLAGLTALAVLGPRSTVRDLRGLDRSGKALLAVNIGFAVVIPSLLFTALEKTSVTNLILLGRLESVAFAAFAVLLLRSTFDRRQVGGFALITAGAVGIVLVDGMGSFMRGDVLVVTAALLQGLAACTAKIGLRSMSTGAFVIVRNTVSAVVFFFIAIGLYGAHHFADAFGPGLWVAMTVYGFAVVALGQLAWYRSLDRVDPGMVATLSMLSPLLSIGYAMVLLGEFPTGLQITGGAVIAIGMVIAARRRHGAHASALPADASLGGHAP